MSGLSWPHKGKHADPVCYWFNKAGRLVAEDGSSRAGIVATNSIRGGKIRAVADQGSEHGDSDA